MGKLEICNSSFCRSVERLTKLTRPGDKHYLFAYNYVRAQQELRNSSIIVLMLYNSINSNLRIDFQSSSINVLPQKQLLELGRGINLHLKLFLSELENLKMPIKLIS